MYNIAVCILFYEKIEQTKECIQNLLPSEIPIYILSNGSSERSVREMSLFCSDYNNIHFLISPINLGTSRGKNILWKKAYADWILFLDNDTRIQPGNWHHTVEKYIQKYGDHTQVFTPVLFNIHDLTVAGRIEIPLPQNNPPMATLFPGGASIISRAFLESMSGFEEKIFVPYEDWELAIRAAQSGIKLRVHPIPEIKIFHEHLPAKTDVDAKAAQERYSLDYVHDSAAYIQKKYNLNTDNATAWSQKQQKIFLGELSLADACIATNPIRAKIYIPKQASPFEKNAPELELSQKIIEKLLICYSEIKEVDLMWDGLHTGAALNTLLHTLTARGIRVVLLANEPNDSAMKQLPELPYYLDICLDQFLWKNEEQDDNADSFNDLNTAYNELRARGISIGFSWTLRKSSLIKIPYLLRLCDTLQPEFLNIRSYIPSSLTFHEERGDVVTAADTDLIEKLQRMTRRRRYISLPTYPHFLSPEHTCKSYLTTITLDAAGNISGCHALIQPTSTYGNIMTDEDPFNSPTMRHLRKRTILGCMPHADCSYCFHRTAVPASYPLPSSEKMSLVRNSGLFDENMYRKQYLLGRKEIITPLEHFLRFGPLKGYRPNPLFDPNWYLVSYPHVARDGINPLLHYILHGRKAGYLTCPSTKKTKHF